MKRLHLICNAHIDPIWQWTWDEGISATISTFKSAADLCDEFDYVFCHGESLLYEAIEAHAPELFERIKAHVKSGKWVITGGWYLQPDCLMPSGETFIRQIAVGKKYFMEKFGVEPTITTNYDSFGHSIGLVQILAKNGYSGYMACRPYPTQFEYPSRFFVWRGPDGSEIKFTESSSYNSRLGHVTEKINMELFGGGMSMLGSPSAADTKLEDVDYILWGVGNHGGGPSRKDLRDIEELKIDGVEIIHSTPEMLFADGIRVGGEVEVSLITCMPGCYSSMARVKQAFRRCESLFYSVERMLAVAEASGMSVDYAPLREAEKRLLLSTFHDILPGSCVEDAEREALTIISAAEKTARDYRSQALLYLAMCDKVAGEGEFPVFAFNYQPYELYATCEVEFMLADQNWSEVTHYHPVVFDAMGNRIPAQLIKENSTLNLDWRKKIVFDATLAPLGMTRFTVKVEGVPASVRASVGSDVKVAIKDAKNIEAPIGLLMYDDTADPWGMSNDELLGMGKNPKEFRMMTPEEVDNFTAAKGSVPVRIIEDGDVYTAVEAIYTHSKTDAVVEYKMYKNHPYTDLKITVEFADKNKLLRVRIPIPDSMKGGDIIGDGPYVWENKPTVGEITFQKWVGIKHGERVFAVINDGVYAGQSDGEYIYLTLLRGAGYCFHPIYDRQLYPTDRYLPRIECGRYTFNLRIFSGDVYEVTKQAEEFAARPYAVNIFPIDTGKNEEAHISVNGDIICPVIKKGENEDLIFRLYNPKNEATEYSVSVGEHTLTDTVKPRAIVTVGFSNNKFTIYTDKTPV